MIRSDLHHVRVCSTIECLTMFTICVCVWEGDCSHLQCMFYDIMYAEINYLLMFLLQFSLCMFHDLMFDDVHYLCVCVWGGGIVPIYSACSTI